MIFNPSYTLFQPQPTFMVLSIDIYVSWNKHKLPQQLRTNTGIVFYSVCLYPFHCCALYWLFHVTHSLASNNGIFWYDWQLIHFKRISFYPIIDITQSCMKGALLLSEIFTHFTFKNRSCQCHCKISRLDSASNSNFFSNAKHRFRWKCISIQIFDQIYFSFTLLFAFVKCLY